MATTKGTSAKTKTSKAKTAPKRDAYDDFLEIMDKRSETVSKGPKKKTTETAEPKKQKSKTTTAKKSGGTKSTTKKTTAKTKPKRDAYDDFLDLAEIREASQAKGSKKTAVTEKPEPKKTTAKRTSASKTGKTSTAKSKAVSKRKSKTDAYDDFLAVVEAKENSRPVRRKKPKKGRGLTAALVCCILILGALFGYQGYQYSRFLGMKKAVTRATYYEGTTVDGIDVSTMTRDEAVEYWRVNVEQNYTSRTVNVSGIGTLTAESLGYTSDYVAVLTNAYGAGRSGSLEERYALLSSRLEMPVAYSVNRREYDPAIVTGFVTTAANAINREPTDAHIASFDMTNYAFTFAEGEPGKQLDTATLESDIITTLTNGGGTVEPVITEIAPSNTVSEISSQYGMISAAVTNASSSSSNRISNIRLAMATINGTCLEPGESFSFNGVVGRRTTERGYKKAGAYANGEVTEEVGGGICQVSTTLFNAVVKADLQIDERHNHSLPVSYVDNGKDATVDYGNQDFRFTNNSDDKIYICCVVTDDKRVRVGIFGKLLPNGETITVESRTTGTVPYTTEYRANMTYASGYSQVTRPGKNGATAEAYKVRHDASGNIISTELLCKSTYKATSEIIEYGP